MNAAAPSIVAVTLVTLATLAQSARWLAPTLLP